jgi:hypothetical protein
MHRSHAFATLALGLALLPSGGAPPRLLAAQRVASVPADTDTTVTPPPLLRLTPFLLRRMTTLMATLRHDPAHLRALVADSAHYVHVPRQVGPFQPRQPELENAGMNLVDTVLDVGGVAATDPVVAAAFKHAHLAPALYLPFATALLGAETNEGLEIMVSTREDTTMRPTAPSDVRWQNVAFLQTHRAALDALHLPVPTLMLRQYSHTFLDTTQHPLRIRRMISDDSLSEPYPWGFLDSTEAPKRSAAARPLRVLFLGNSLTYVNSLPRFFSIIAAQGLQRRVVVGLVALSGVSGVELWMESDVRRVIQEMPWDVIVVQLKPTETGRQRAFPYYARLFTQVSAPQHARTVLWTEWESNYWLDKHPTLDSAWVALTAAAKATGATVTPITQAFAAVRRTDPSTWQALFRNPEDAHPSALGSYLTALTIYQTITGRSPIEAPRTFTGFKIELPRTTDSQPMYPTTDSLTIPARTAALLQRAAAATFHRRRR